jgi:CO dehydrogenase maturation factor
MKIAITGKGGVGKTFIAGSLSYLFYKKGLAVLAVDADSNANLAYTLGVDSEKIKYITPLSENSELIKKKTGIDSGYFGAIFNLNFTVDDIIENYSVETPSGVNLLVMGTVRKATGGCMCPANHLLRMLLRHLLVGRKEIVILDMEAGIEHLGRGTAEHADAMLIVVEPSLKAFKTAINIRNFAFQMGIKKTLLIGNKIFNEKEKEVIEKFSKKNQIPILGIIHYDSLVREADLSGTSLFISFPSAPVLREINTISNNLIDLVEDREK